MSFSSLYSCESFYKIRYGLIVPLVTLAACCTIGILIPWEWLDPRQCDNSVNTSTLGWIRLGGAIGKGSFSVVLEGMVLATKQLVAVKIGVEQDAGLWRDEQILGAVNGSDLFPYYYGSGWLGCTHRSGRSSRYPFIVLELLGPPLTQDFEGNEPADRIVKAIKIADQLVRAVEIMHKQLGYVVHDMYPNNVLGKLSDSSQVKLVDFGEVIRTDLHAKDHSWGPAMTYTPLNSMFSSIREDKREALSQRDDLERVVYLMIILARGADIPWANRKMKAEMSLENICAGMPIEFVTLLRYARETLRFQEDIDFVYVGALLKSAITRK